MAENPSNILRLSRLGIDTHTENMIFVRTDLQVCRLESFTARIWVVVAFKDRSIIATLPIITSDLILDGETPLSDYGFERLQVVQ